MKRTFIAPQLRRIEINLSNDIAVGSVPITPEDGTYPIWVWTWQMSSGIRTDSCRGFVKGGTALSNAVEDYDMTLEQVQAHVNAHDAAAHYGGKLDQCMFSWATEVTAEDADVQAASGGAVFLGYD